MPAMKTDTVFPQRLDCRAPPRIGTGVIERRLLCVYSPGRAVTADSDDAGTAAAGRRAPNGCCAVDDLMYVAGITGRGLDLRVSQREVVDGKGDAGAALRAARVLVRALQAEIVRIIDYVGL